MKVLLVDDDVEVRRVVRRSFEREGFDVVEAADGEEAVALVARTPFDITVLDLHLPGMSGMDVLTKLRERDPDLHVIILTGAGNEADRVSGLVSGADDYLVKPFSPRELAARAVAVRRRRTAARPAVVDTGGLRIDTVARAVSIGGEPVDLTRREFDLLAHLAAHPERTFTRAELLEAVWGSSAEWQSEKTVTEHIRRLRMKTEFDPANPVRIVSVRGYGYRFDPPGGEAAHRPVTLPAAGGETTQDATVVLVGATIVHASPGALELVGARTPSDVVGRQVFDFVAPQSVGAARVRHESAMRGVSPRPDVITVVRVDGEEVLVELSTARISWEGEQATLVTMWDLTGDSAKLQELATGISTDVPEAIVIADAQLRIQSFNPAAEDLYGWREEEVLGRIMMEVMPWLRDDATADEAREAFQRDGRWHGKVVQRRRDGSSVTVLSSSTLLRDSAGQPVGVISVNRPVDPSSGRRLVDRSSVDAALEAEIRRGIEEREFVVYYQPVLFLEGGRWSGVEALVRWRHPDRGVLTPAAFIEVAERSGAIIDLGQLVLDDACRQGAAWRRDGHDLYISVNLSTRQFADANLLDRVAGSLARTSFPPDKLWLEITETSLVDDLDQAAEVLHRIADLGARLSIDDFGTGWSSLTYLREFPIGSLKIDRLFVAGLGTGSPDAAIVTSIISLGRELGLFVVAEGIETHDQRTHLLALGCQLGQGYLFSRPQPPHALDMRGHG